MTDWAEPLRELFTTEIDSYKRLLSLELQKREAIHSADGKALESFVKQSYHIMVEASECERLRMRTIEDFYQKENVERPEGQITLSQFMNQMDRDSNFKLKGLTTQLKAIVYELKEAILTNDKLLKNRKDFLNHTIESIKEKSKEKVYTKANQPIRRDQDRQSSVMLNATA